MFCTSQIILLCSYISLIFLTVGMDYTLSDSDNIEMRTRPTVINVTLLNDGVVGEDVEEIVLTLIQSSITPSDINQFLVYDRVHITVRDNDSMWLLVTLDFCFWHIHVFVQRP